MHDKKHSHFIVKGINASQFVSIEYIFVAWMSNLCTDYHVYTNNN